MSILLIKDLSFTKKISLAVISGLVAFLILGFVQTVGAHQDPATCSANGVGISISVYRNDETTVIGGADTVAPGEVIKYRTTLSALGLPNCNFSGGTLTITTPDGITDVTPGGGIPLVSVGSPFVSAFVSYTVDSADLGGDGDVDASSNYSNGESHIGAIHDTASGTVNKQTLFAKVSPTISTTPNPANGTVGDMLNDTATLSGGFSPTGSVTFKLYPPADSTCSGTASYTDADASAPYATSPGFASNAAGVWHWTADYAGDANNNATSSGCTAEPVTVAAAKGHIIVDKVTDPSGSSQSFSFTTSGSGYNGFSLTDAASPNNQELDAGTYSVSETLPDGWDQTSATCVSSLGESEVETIGNLELDAGETITCTFTNTQQMGHIIVDKVTDPSGDPTSFSFDATGDGYDDFSLTDSADPNDQTLVAGSYSVSETLPANWTQDSATCVSSMDDTETIGSLDLDPGETITCTFHNTMHVVQWCSPGYWRNHLDSWGPTEFETGDSFFEATGEDSSIFPTAKKNPKFAPSEDPTLLEILQSPQIYGGEAFNLVGDLLSEAHPDVDFEDGDARIENCPLN